MGPFLLGWIVTSLICFKRAKSNNYPSSLKISLVVGLIIGGLVGGGISIGIGWLSPKEQIYSDPLILDSLLTAKDGTKKFILEGKIRVIPYYIFQLVGAEQLQELRGTSIIIIKEERNGAILREYTEVFPNFIYWFFAIHYDWFRTKYEFRIPERGSLVVLSYRDDITIE